MALDIQIYTKYIHTLNSPRFQPPSLEKTFYATYAYYDGDQRTTYECIYLGKCRAFIEMRECNKNGHFVCFPENLEFIVLNKEEFEIILPFVTYKHSKSFFGLVLDFPRR